MKSFRTLAVAAAIALIALIGLCAGCATTSTQPPTPAQIASIVCPQLDLAGTELATFNAVLIADPATQAIGIKANADLAKLVPIVGAVCAAGATVTASNLSALIQQALPAFGTLVGSLPLPTAQKTQIQCALVLAEAAAGVVGVVEAQIKAAQAAQSAPASASTAASPAK